jgi:hypothetical protein
MKSKSPELAGSGCFSKRVKIILAQRAGYRCSFPGCDRTTIGPGPSQDDVASIGIAAHIYSASERGPRGTAGLSGRTRAKPENGIWLCSHHAVLIDQNRGVRYPPAKLLRLKYRHEARIAMDQGHRPFAWVESLTLHRSKIFADDVSLRFLANWRSSLGITAAERHSSIGY